MSRSTARGPAAFPFRRRPQEAEADGHDGLSLSEYPDTLVFMSAQVDETAPSTQTESRGDSRRNTGVPADFSPKDLLAWLRFVLTLGLGLALGAENLAATGAPGLIRVPALLAALILCGQSRVDIDEYFRKKRADAAAQRRAAERAKQVQQAQQQAQAHASETGGNGDLASRAQERTAQTTGALETTAISDATAEAYDQFAEEEEARERAGVGAAVGESRPGLIIVLVLAIWLGLATLNYPQSPTLLLVLSSVASFALFVSVWSGLQRRPVA
jgi:hypothetical protein